MLQFYNTLAKKKQEFIPISPGKVSIYTCGPTVYDYIHIGNIRAYLTADILRRYLEYKGFEVRHIKNITDVGHLTNDGSDTGDDKIQKKASKEKKTPHEIVTFYEDYFKVTEEKMNIIPAHFFPRATGHISHMIKVIKKLIEKEHAYVINGNVFFKIATFPDYGKLSGNIIENMKTGSRLEKHPDKKDPRDFALWLKARPEHIMHWDSPWSVGYPGWHIECSAMSMEYLGYHFDIHTGGEDNIIPHHEAEIAQSESYSEEKFVNYWIHSRHLLVDGKKMAKSKENFYTLEDVIERGFTPMELRLAILGSHYRSQMNFTWDILKQAKINYEKILKIFIRLEDLPDDSCSNSNDKNIFVDIVNTFELAMDDDLNTPLALSVLFELITEINKNIDQNSLENRDETKKMLLALLTSLGIKIYEKNTTISSIPKEIYNLAERRHEARKNKDFKEADRLRGEIQSAHYDVKDTLDNFEIIQISKKEENVNL